MERKGRILECALEIDYDLDDDGDDTDDFLA